MSFEKIFLLWSASWQNFLSVPVATWLGLVALHLQRFYRALCTTYMIFVLVFLIGLTYFYHIPFCVSAIWLSMIVYLMRPSIALKNKEYARDYFFLENLAAVLFFTLVSLCLVYRGPAWLRAIVFLYALVSYFFLYDTKDSLPAACGKALVRSFYLILYKMPFFLLLAIIVCLFEYAPMHYLVSSLSIMSVYPLVSALVAILYVNGIHENYELYYAE